MQTTLHLDELPGAVGRTFGPSDWMSVDQTLVDEFARATGDHAWYHVDTTRAASELPDGLTFAHGLLTLSLLPVLGDSILRLTFPTRALNYGYDNIRFLTPVQVGSRIRLTRRLVSLERHKHGTLIRLRENVTTDSADALAMVATQLILALRST